MATVPVCIFLDDSADYEKLVSECGEDLAKCANDMLIHVCFLSQHENQSIFLDNGEVDFDATIFVRKLPVPYLNKITDLAGLAEHPPLVPFLADELVPFWIMEFEVFVGVPESHLKAFRLRSCSAKLAVSYRAFRDSFWI